jgi:hypothetical protein
MERDDANSHGSLAGQLAELNRTLLAVFDLPYGAARRYLITGTPLPPGLRADLRALLDEQIVWRGS